MDKLLDDLKDYDYILRFKNTIEKMEPELSGFKREIEANRRIISSQTHVGFSRANYCRNGIRARYSRNSFNFI